MQRNLVRDKPHHVLRWQPDWLHVGFVVVAVLTPLAFGLSASFLPHSSSDSLWEMLSWCGAVAAFLICVLHGLSEEDPLPQGAGWMSHTWLLRLVLGLLSVIAFLVPPATGAEILVKHLPPAVEAAAGEGAGGTFTVTHRYCRSACRTWGEFDSDDGRIRVTSVDVGFGIGTVGERVRALYNDGRVYLPGTKAWIPVAAWFLNDMALGLLGIALAWQYRPHRLPASLKRTRTGRATAQ
ncbi:hypothetical protein ACFFHJ_26490 [Planotetraspora thailandica]|nr:hypothetical protein [Planotetraspora thailandica]